MCTNTFSDFFSSTAAWWSLLSSDLSCLFWCKHLIQPKSHTAPLSVSSGESLFLKVSESALFPCCEFNTSTLIIQQAILPGKKKKKKLDTTAGTERLMKRGGNTSVCINSSNVSAAFSDFGKHDF